MNWFILAWLVCGVLSLIGTVDGPFGAKVLLFALGPFGLICAVGVLMAAPGGEGPTEPRDWESSVEAALRELRDLGEPPELKEAKRAANLYLDTYGVNPQEPTALDRYAEALRIISEAEALRILSEAGRL